MNTIELAKEAGFTDHEAFAGYECTTSELLSFAAIVAANEREACAEEAESAASDDNKYDIAAAIRARSEK